MQLHTVQPFRGELIFGSLRAISLLANDSGAYMPWLPPALCSHKVQLMMFRDSKGHVQVARVEILQAVQLYRTRDRAGRARWQKSVKEGSIDCLQLKHSNK